MQIEKSINRRDAAPRLVKLAGIVYIVFGLYEILNYFYQTPIDYFQLFLYTAIGIGLLERHSWSRILCIVISTITLLAALVALIFYREVFWTNLTVTWGRWYAVAQMVIHSGILYILLRSDVRKLFSEKDN